jgi:PadR family transcriptional regulator, regulatory protein PadR
MYNHYRITITLNDNSENVSMIRNLFTGFIRVHILYHASKEPIFGLDMIRELERHGYKLSPGTLYPILHSLENKKFLSSNYQTVNGKVRKYYAITRIGLKQLEEAKNIVKELLGEIYE